MSFLLTFSSLASPVASGLYGTMQAMEERYGMKCPLYLYVSIQNLVKSPYWSLDMMKKSRYSLNESAARQELTYYDETSGITNIEANSGFFWQYQAKDTYDYRTPPKANDFRGRFCERRIKDDFLIC